MTKVWPRNTLCSTPDWASKARAQASPLPVNKVPAWYLRALTPCLCAGNVRTLSPVSASQHLTVLSALPVYKSRSVSCRKSGRVNSLALMVRQASNHYLQGGKHWQDSMGKSRVTPEGTSQCSTSQYWFVFPLVNLGPEGRASSALESPADPRQSHTLSLSAG